MTKAEYHDWFAEVLRPTELTFQLVPHDKIDFKLTERSFSVGQQLSHMPGALSFFAKVLRKEEVPFKSLREIMVANRRQPSVRVDEGIRFLKSSVASFEHAIDQLTESQFQTGLLDTPQKGTISYWRYCAFALEHHIHHLMELHICLRVLGIDVNTKSLYGG